MKLAMLALLSFPVLLAPRAGDELRAVHREGRVVTNVSAKWSATELDEVSMRVNGEEVAGEPVEQLAASMPSKHEEERVTTTTWVDAVEDGRPVRVRRRFDEAEKVEVEGDEETESEGVLAGRSILIEGDDDEATAELDADDDGAAVDDVYLEGHRLAPDSDLYLPDEPVDVGDTWELDEDVVRRILGIGRDGPVLFEKDEDDDDEGFLAVLEEAAEVSGTVEYVDREEVDGVDCAVLLLTLEVEVGETEIDPEEMGMEPEEGMDVTAEVAVTMTGQERLWFALEAGHAVRSEGEMEGRLEMSIVMANEEVGLEIEIDVTADLTGGFTSTTTVE